MTLIELQECMNTYITMWKTQIQGESHRDSVMKLWQDRGFLKYEKDLLIKAFYEYEDTAEKPYVAPRPKQIMDAYKTVKARFENKGRRRIVTEDEEMYNIYLQEMAKPVEKRNEWLIRQCLPSCEIMTNPEAFKKKYGTYREEYERY